MTRLAVPAADSATICKLLQWNGPATLPDCVRAAAKSATICKRPLRRAVTGRRRAGASASGLQAEQACSNARRPIVIMNVSGMAPRHRSGTQSWTRVTACSACYRLFRSLRPLRMLHCTALLARILPNDCNGLDPSLPRPAAPPSAAALVFSLIFTSAVPSFAASQPGTPPSGRAGANAAFPSTLERMYCITLIFKRARRPVAGPPSSGGSLEGEGRVGGLRPPFLANKNADAERRLSKRSGCARGGVKMSGTRVR
jgi:hypothetical protein